MKIQWNSLTGSAIKAELARQKAANEKFGYSYVFKFDARKKAFKGCDKKIYNEFFEARSKIARMRRPCISPSPMDIEHCRHLVLLKDLKRCSYDPSCSSSRHGISGIDWCAFYRRSSIGGLYFCAPDEPANCRHYELGSFEERLATKLGYLPAML